jgi:hypothetical protein
MSDTDSDYTEQTGMVSEFTLEREVRRERAAAAAAAADPATVASSGGGVMTHSAQPQAQTPSRSYRGGVEESKIPEEPAAVAGGMGEDEEDLVGDEDDEIASGGGIGQRTAAITSSAVAAAAPDASSNLRVPTESTAAATPTTGRTNASAGQAAAPGEKKIQAAVGKARQASARAVRSVIQYEREHAIVQTAWAGVQHGVRLAGRKVRECTSVDTTAPAPADGDGSAPI